jgi:hypothetical protein
MAWLEDHARSEPRGGEDLGLQFRANSRDSAAPSKELVASFTPPHEDTLHRATQGNAQAQHHIDLLCTPSISDARQLSPRARVQTRCGNLTTPSIKQYHRSPHAITTTRQQGQSTARHTHQPTHGVPRPSGNDSCAHYHGRKGLKPPGAASTARRYSCGPPIAHANGCAPPI